MTIEQLMGTHRACRGQRLRRVGRVLVGGLLGLGLVALALSKPQVAYAQTSMMLTTAPGNRIGQIYVQWPSITNASSYEVCADSSCTSRSSSQGDSTVFNSLSTGTQYTITVTAQSSSGQTLASGTTTAYPAGATIPDVSAIAPTSSEMAVQITDASSSDTYQVADGSYSSAPESPATSSLTIDLPLQDAAPGSTISVTAYGDGNADEASAPANFTVLSPVQDLSATLAASGTLAVSWTAPSLPGGVTFTEYSVLISGSGQSYTASTTSTSLTLSQSTLGFTPTSAAIQVEATDSSYSSLGYSAEETSVEATAAVTSASSSSSPAPPPPQPVAVGETCGAAGTMVQIWGQDLAGSIVRFAGVDSGPVTVLSASEVQVAVPHGVSRDGRIVVIGAGGSAALPGWVHWSPACPTTTLLWATPAGPGEVTLHVAVVGQGNCLSGKTVVVLGSDGAQVARLTTAASPSTVLVPLVDGPFQAVFDGDAHCSASASGEVA